MYKWVPARVEVDIVYDKALGETRQPRAVHSPKVKGMLLANDQGTNVKSIETLLKTALYKN